MADVVLIGDEIAAAGFALAGADTRPAVGPGLRARFDDALRTARLVVLTPTAASGLDPQALHAAVLRGTPPVLVMPDLVAPRADAAFAQRIRAALGIER